MSFIDLMDHIGIDKDRAWDFYEKMRGFLFNNAVAEPEFVLADVVEDEEVIGAFFEEHWRNHRLFLSSRILEFKDDGKFFYLTHEIVHYLDWHILGKCRTENETDTEAIRILTGWGVWHNG